MGLVSSLQDRVAAHPKSSFHLWNRNIGHGTTLRFTLVVTVLVISDLTYFAEAAYFLKLAASEQDVTGLKFLEKP